MNEIYINLAKLSAAKNDFPHMVALGYEKSEGDIDFRCTGTILNEKFVLTASDCVNAE